MVNSQYFALSHKHRFFKYRVRLACILLTLLYVLKRIQSGRSMPQ